MVPVFALLGEWRWMVLILALLTVYGWGRHDGAALKQLECDKVGSLVSEAIERGQRGAAQEIAKLEVKHVTVQRRIERETRDVPVYRDCQHSADGLRAVNDALANRAESAGDDELPGEPGGAAGR